MDLCTRVIVADVLLRFLPVAAVRLHAAAAVIVEGFHPFVRVRSAVRKGLHPVDGIVEIGLGRSFRTIADAVAGQEVEPCRDNVAAQLRDDVIAVLGRCIDQRLGVLERDEEGIFTHIGKPVAVVVAHQQTDLVGACLVEDRAIIVAIDRDGINGPVIVGVDSIEQVLIALGRGIAIREPVALVRLVVGNAVPEGAAIVRVLPEARGADTGIRIDQAEVVRGIAVRRALVGRDRDGIDVLPSLERHGVVDVELLVRSQRHAVQNTIDASVQAIDQCPVLVRIANAIGIQIDPGIERRVGIVERPGIGRQSR